MMHGPQNVKRILDVDHSINFIVILPVSIILKYHITLSCNCKSLVVATTQSMYSVSIENPEEKGYFERHRRRWENDIAVDIKEMRRRAWTGLT